MTNREKSISETRTMTETDDIKPTGLQAKSPQDLKTDNNDQSPTLKRGPVKDILFVDDEGELRKIFKRALEGFGYNVRVAANGKEGMKLFRENLADLIITDIFMPEIDGHTFIYEVIDKFPKTNIFAITGHQSIFGMEMELDIAETLGAKQVFTKPVRLIELIKAIKDLECTM